MITLAKPIVKRSQKSSGKAEERSKLEGANLRAMERIHEMAGVLIAGDLTNSRSSFRRYAVDFNSPHYRPGDTLNFRLAVQDAARLYYESTQEVLDILDGGGTFGANLE